MSVKILHTSDWHLGKRLYKKSRMQEQVLFLDWLETTIVEKNIDILIISGDIFDSPNPPNDALKAYFNFLRSITNKKDIEIYIISGNHDSGNFIEAPKAFLGDKKINVFGTLENNIEDYFIAYNKNEVKIHLCILPYFKSQDIYKKMKQLDVSINNPKEAYENITLQIEKIFTLFNTWSQKDSGHCRILVAHHLFGNFQAAGSEQALFLSGIDSIPSSILENKFDYIALGHIHKPQIVKKTNPLIYYSGSPIPMRFSETEVKSVAIVEIDKNSFNHDTVQIPRFRDLFRVSGDFETVERKINALCLNNTNINAFAEVTIEIDRPIIGLGEKVRKMLFEKNIELLSFQTILPSEDDDESKQEILNKFGKIPDPIELFKVFYKNKYPQQDKLPEEIYNDFLQILTESSTVNEEESLS